jgi:hypothetical protein
MRPLISPPLNCSFRLVYDAIAAQPSGRTPQLETTGGTPFTAEAKVARDGRQFIALPHSNRIYESDWGYSTNGMGKGKGGQRIGHYSVPIDSWAAGRRSG